MGAQGQTTINFFAFPGVADQAVVITGQGGILTTSLVEAWIAPVATADHSIDEHIIDPPMVTAGSIIAGSGFSIYAQARDGVPVPDAIVRSNAPVTPPPQEHGRRMPMPYGLWTVNWVWN